MPLNSTRVAVEAPTLAKIEQVDLRVVTLGVGQLPTRVVPTKTPPLPKPVNVVPAGKVTSIVLVPAAESPPVAVVGKLATYWVRAPAALDGDALATVIAPSVLGAATVYVAEATGVMSLLVATVSW